MRTRRSPRNQERLWRELGGKVEKPKPIVAIRTDVENVLAIENKSQPIEARCS